MVELHNCLHMMITMLNTGFLRIEKPGCMLMMLCYYGVQVSQPWLSLQRSMQHCRRQTPGNGLQVYCSTCSTQLQCPPSLPR